MSKKYIAKIDCEYQGKLFHVGESVLFDDDVEVCTLAWEPEVEYLKAKEEDRVLTKEALDMTAEEKTTRIKDLSKRLKEAEKALKEKKVSDAK